MDLGSLGGTGVEAWDVTPDGTVVVGNAGLASGDSHAFLWTSVTGMQDIDTLGSAESTARAVSADGSVVVGRNFFSAFRVQSSVLGDSYWRTRRPSCQFLEYGVQA